MTKDEALKMAIEAFENYEYEKRSEVIQACRMALEQQEIGDAEIKQMLNDIEYYQKRVEALEQPAWQGLTDDERDNFIAMAIEIEFGVEAKELVFAIEQALKEKNHGQ